MNLLLASPKFGHDVYIGSRVVRPVRPRAFCHRKALQQRGEKSGFIRGLGGIGFSNSSLIAS